MKTESNCPVCEARSWRKLASRVFKRDESLLSSNEYTAKRMKVLFEVWFPSESEVVLESSLCQTCGFITNLPRVEEKDIDAKYRFLEKLGQDYGSFEKQEVEALRSSRLWSHLKSYLKSSGDVLDFGGGDGRLMKEFVERGHSCFLVDYNASPRKEVCKLADTLEGLEPGKVFDAIVCNHVIEHVAEPVNTLRGLARHLKPQAPLMVEVPMEIWAKPPLSSDPVTHVNFFCCGSLARAFEEAGLRVLTSRMIGYVHPSGKIHPAVLCIGEKSLAKSAKTARSGMTEVERLLKPNLWDRIQRKWKVR